MTLLEVVSGPQCPELVSSAFARSVRDESSIGTRHSAEFFGTIQVVTRGISFAHHPSRTLMQNLVQLRAVQTQLSMRTHTARAIRVQARGDLLQVRFDLLNRSYRYQKPYAAVDVIADAAGEITPSGKRVATTPPIGKP